MRLRFLFCTSPKISTVNPDNYAKLLVQMLLAMTHFQQEVKQFQIILWTLKPVQNLPRLVNVLKARMTWFTSRQWFMRKFVPQNIGKLLITIKETVNYLDIMDRHHAEENPQNIMKAKKTKKWLLLISIWIIKLKLQIDTLLVVVGYGRHFNLLYDTFGQRPDLNNECAVRLRILKRGVDHVCRERRANYNENSVFCFMKPVLASGRQWHLHLEIENSPSN